MIQARCGQSRRDRFAKCGSFAWVERAAEPPERYRVVASLCHDRHCLPCQKLHAATVASNLMAACAHRTVRFVTLTLRHTHAPLADQLDRLYQSFRRLRQRQWWRDHVDGGAAFCEITHNVARDEWHPHLHILVLGRWMAKSVLAAEWMAVTGDSHIVDIRRPENVDHAAHYVTKYVSKGLPASDHLPIDRLTELVSAMHGRRSIICFGVWVHLKLTQRPDGGDWISVGSVPQIVRAASRGDAEAARVLAIAYGVDSWTVALICAGPNQHGQADSP
jgi:hypothetical protein